MMKNFKKNLILRANSKSLARFLPIQNNDLKILKLERYQDKNSPIIQCRTHCLNFIDFQLNLLTNPIALGSAAMHG
jgi:hypothetical protein